MLRGTIARRMRRTLSVLAVLAIVGALLAACGEAEDLGAGNGAAAGEPPIATPPTEPSPTTTAERIEHPTGADELILRIEHVGGFVMPEMLLTRLPLFALYGDGCYIVQGPQIEIFPPPALPNLQETCLTEEGVQEILRLAQDAGLLDEDESYDLDTVADAPTTVFTVNANGKTVVTEAYALGIDAAPGPDVTEEEAEARQKLAMFEQKIVDISSWASESMIAEPEHPYEIERLQLIVAPADAEDAPAAPEEIDPGTMEWPLETSLAEFGEPHSFTQGARCGVVEGEPLDILLEKLQEANTLTRWTSNGEEYVFLLRPLLPDEQGCQEPVLQ